MTFPTFFLKELVHTFFVKNFFFLISFSEILNKATPYNWSGLYRFKKNFWGFCMNKEEYKKIKNKNYFVEGYFKNKKTSFKLKNLSSLVNIDKNLLI